MPGIFGRNATVDKAYTTLYASDRDMFVFLADEDRRIEIPNRRDGKPGSLTRGFFVWNSELGNTTLGGGFFLFDYVCSNRYVWDTDRTPRSASAIRVGTRLLARRGEPGPSPVCGGQRQAGIAGDRRRPVKRIEADLNQFLAGAPCVGAKGNEEIRPIIFNNDEEWRSANRLSHNLSYC